MSIIGSNILAGASGQGGGYTIERSLRLRSSASAYLNRTPASAGNRKTWTWSGWVKRGALGNLQTLFGINVVQNDSQAQGIFFGSDGKLYVTPWTNTNFISNAIFRDLSAWYHIVVAFDSTNATANNRVIVYVNGVNQTGTYPLAVTLNADYGINQAGSHRIGDWPASGFSTFDGYITEVNFIDGQALDPSSFGKYNEDTGVWQPKKYVGSYGTNGFYLNFSNNANTTALGYDYSGNGNNWTTNNFSLTSGYTYDSMKDVPTLTSSIAANYATLNPIDTASSSTVSDGNLKQTCSYGPSRSNASIRIPSSGKFYAEFINSSATNSSIGIGFGVSADSVALTGGYNASNSYHFYASTVAYVVNNGSLTSISSWTNLSNQTFQLAVDVDNGKVWIGQNNTWWDSSGGSTGNPSTGANPTFTLATSGFKVFTYIDSATSINWYANFGASEFTYSAPGGFKRLNTYNLPDSTIVDGSQYFNTVLYTGNNVDRSITGVGFQPDFTWIKSRSTVGSHVLYDSVRGALKELYSNTTNAESAETNGLDYWESDGFHIKYLRWNSSPNTYAAWNWRASGSTVSNNAGSITSTVSANTTAGFSIVTYTGNGTSGATVGHGLGVKPAMIIGKNRSGAAQNWQVWHQSIGDNVMQLNLTNAQVASTSNSVFLVSGINTTVFQLGTNPSVNGSSTTQVAYCFAEVEGYSKFGSYTGNGSSNGTFAYTGFRPRWLMVKRTDTTASWLVIDTSRDVYNAAGLDLYPNLSNAEGDDRPVLDILSNGFNLRSTYASTNASGGTYIYAAFAENPFKNSLAR